jgi:tRNA (Thr-GGU) A37 N-methylase
MIFYKLAQYQKRCFEAPVDNLALMQPQVLRNRNSQILERVTYLVRSPQITVRFHLHKKNGYDLMVKHFMYIEEHEIFANKQSNVIVLTKVRLSGIENNFIRLEVVDMLNTTPLIDIKPFFAKFDNRTNTKFGWLDDPGNNTSKELRSDERLKLEYL